MVLSGSGSSWWPRGKTPTPLSGKVAYVNEVYKMIHRQAEGDSARSPLQPKRCFTSLIMFEHSLLLNKDYSLITSQASRKVRFLLWSFLSKEILSFKYYTIPMLNNEARSSPQILVLMDWTGIRTLNATNILNLGNPESQNICRS